MLPCASATACTSPAPVYTPGTGPRQLVWSVDRVCVCVCDLGADGLWKSSAGEGRVSGPGLEEAIAVDKRQEREAEWVITADNPVDNKGIVTDCTLSTREAGRIGAGGLQ